MKIKQFIKKTWNKIGNCEFKKKCPYFDEKSGVCLGGGGNYCGQWREFQKFQRSKKSKK